jgi:hypothetical protein
MGAAVVAPVRQEFVAGLMPIEDEEALGNRLS